MRHCTSPKSGSDAAVHGISDFFERNDCESVLLIDAENAFNLVNRKAALHNTAVIFPENSTFTTNFYQENSLYFFVVENIIERKIITKRCCSIGNVFLWYPLSLFFIH